MDEYISKKAVFQVVHGIARGIATKDIESLNAKDMKTFYKIKGAKEILDSVDTDLCYIPIADVQPVVHCKDCKHRKERHYEESGEKPYIKYECKFTKYSMSDDGFCSFGAKMLEKPNLQLLKNAVDLIQKAKEIKVDGARMDGNTK